MKLNLSKTQQIQFTFPAEPDWKSVENGVLIELIEDYISEPSCATSALCELSSRDTAKTIALCTFLLDEEHSDKRLKQSALSSLLSLDFRKGCDLGLKIIDDCDLDVLSILLESLNYELQGDDKCYILQHE